MKIFLIGMPGTGKTTLGKQLASTMELPFIDTDELIEQAYGHPIPKLFSDIGETDFRALEQKVLFEIEHQSNAVVSTGGGMACNDVNLQQMLKTGKVVWCYTPLHHLTNRIWFSKRSRPLFDSEPNKETLKAKIELLWSEREPYYKQAHFHINMERINAKQLAALLSYSL